MSDSTDDEIDVAPTNVEGFRQRLLVEARVKRELREEIKALRSQVEEIKKAASTHESAAGELVKIRSEYEAARASWDAERAVYAIGILEPEAIAVAKTLHGSLPDKDRPALSDWLRSLKEDPAKAPKALAAYFPPAPKIDDKPADKATTRQAAPSTTTTAGASTQPSPEQLRAVYMAAVKANSPAKWAEWDAIRGRKR